MITIDGAGSSHDVVEHLEKLDTDVGAAVTTTDEAIVLYLQTLNTDLADRALALKLMVQIQMQAGEFDKALDSARHLMREPLIPTRAPLNHVPVTEWRGCTDI